MCLGIPGKIIDVKVEHDLLTGLVDFGGVRRNICLEHVPTAKPGDYVLVHVGFALACINADEAQRLLALLDGDLADFPGEGA